MSLHPETSSQPENTLLHPLEDGKLVPTPADSAARAVLSNIEAWPAQQMVLVGPAQSGCSSLAAQLANQIQASLIKTPHSILSASPPSLENGLVIDDADSLPVGEALLSALNLCRTRRVPILLTAHQCPALWPTMIRDLQSRLDALPSVHIAPPCAQTLNLRLDAACRRHFIRLPTPVARHLAQHMPRDYRLLETLAAHLARLSDGQTLTLSLARKALAQL